MSATGAWVLLAQSSGGFFRDRSHDDSCVANNGICPRWAWDNFDRYTHPFVQHLELVLISTGAGFVIASALALVAHQRRWLIAPVTQISAILYTIPSLALFQLLVPFTGLSVTTAEIALVSYTLLILFRNILTGLREVPEDVRESARGMGLSSRQILWRVELPLALPAIVAGLRVAVVTVISLATVAAFVVDEGLGAPIFQSISSPFNTAFIAAGALAVLLALAADALLVGAQRLLTPWAVRQ